MGWSSRQVAVGDAQVTVNEAGAGSPLLVLHDEMGTPGWQEWHAALAADHRLIAPVIPGFAGNRLPWIRQMRDLVPFMGRMLREQGWAGCDAVGLSFGGWLLAEMAVQNPGQFARLALVAPLGLKAPQGEIADIFLMTTAEYLRRSFVAPDDCAEFTRLFGQAAPETIEGWEDARVECAQLGWEPYMHAPAMPQLLGCAGELPVRVIWGEGDVMVPRSVAEAYAHGFPGGELEVIAAAGHFPQIERSREVSASLGRWFADAQPLKRSA